MTSGFGAIALVTCAALASAIACSGHSTVAPQAAVRFYFDAPLCGLKLPVVFSIDHVQVGTDTFAVNAGTTRHLSSTAFPVDAGTHIVGAYGTFSGTTSRYVWPDTQVSLTAGQTFTDTLPLYCS